MQVLHDSRHGPYCTVGVFVVHRFFLCLHQQRRHVFLQLFLAIARYVLLHTLALGRSQPEASGIALARFTDRLKGDFWSNLSRFSWKFCPVGLPVIQSRFSQWCKSRKNREKNEHKRQRGESDDEVQRMHSEDTKPVNIFSLKIQNGEHAHSCHFKPLIRDVRTVEGKKQETIVADVVAKKRNDEFLLLWLSQASLLPRQWLRPLNRNALKMGFKKFQCFVLGCLPPLLIQRQLDQLHRNFIRLSSTERRTYLVERFLSERFFWPGRFFVGDLLGLQSVLNPALFELSNIERHVSVQTESC